jgi:L1 cell adhesion molecule like protein
LGIETDGGVMSVIIKRNTPIPIKQTNTYATVYDNRANVSFGVFELELAMTKNIPSLGKFELTGIPPAQCGIPQIDIIFHIDANGILNVGALENSTGKENKIAVTKNNGRLSNEEIEFMKKDALKYSAENEKQKHTNSAQNVLKSYCYKLVIEIGKVKDNISEYDRRTILNTCNEVFRWLDDNQLAENEVFDSKQKELESVCNRIMKKMYEGAGDMPGWMPGVFSGAGDPALEDGKTPRTGLLQSGLFGRPNEGELHKKLSDTGFDETGENKGGKQSCRAHIRNLSLSLSLSA